MRGDTMTEWLLLLAPVALLALVVMFLFVGCFLDSVGKPGPDRPTGPLYKETILATPDLVAYWRLSEMSGETTAIDELLNHSGTYTQVDPVEGIDTEFGAS